jgi:hypothetical protein
MGLLDLIGGMGQAGAAPAMQRLTSGMGQQGGMLQHMGLGQYGKQAGAGAPGMAGQMGQQGGFASFLHNLGGQLSGQGGSQASDGGWGAQSSGQDPGSQQAGLADLVRQYMAQNQRQQ